ncbi:UDP-N-acetylmuramoyl-L-alanyl-D-glutamate--2,6-diaminopimelate ligase [Campylobacter geochelonis]|uniref:UDP-N-acetylmuramoyl-L-alanyl-D-glutamate--2,6-diaminopimelate ligase n=1 Tax=Campylobacter geochelonis TaxID=1780362 RepID=A0A128EC37_9BACT|nr:UDP-N-acetylmuramoyl-L-alanyl-D-glutamate--2,6-diaminopimelate ligase [Campylobacter geochelonis]QKF72180.1 UDP-N-acetylmuramoylalanyl-D-glutamate 2,6-diaminopimelate ligase [Campylobacter geochelonis]CZE46566.1 UDP-N-acetylmuramoylalanyl-D-glutamate--2%2C 6-diaminopimelate ligase [Campylobacter geochelonis]CZE49733.1 UDP-N-acetylmuramoylalanyl-D-glutamate--2%2C 6-diaminopimelate ligase [Campylobacter geochelonis]
MKIQINSNFITDNSNECEARCYFLKTDANAKFSDIATQKGASIISVNEAKKLLNIDENIKIVGITGTNGKTTTAAAIYSILLDLGYKCFLCGTRGAFANDKRVDEKGLTTSSVIANLNYLKEATKLNCEYFIMEVSSHAIAQNRVEGLNFALKIFTNLSQDHLDYHKTMQEYARVKSSFFLDENTPKLINNDDEHIKFSYKNTQTYAIKKPATYSVVAYGLKNGINAVLRTPDGEVEIESDMVGEFNLYNLMAAFAGVKFLTKKPNSQIAKALQNFAGVEGRVEVVSQKPLVIVDFAHTPDGIEKVLNALKSNELIVVFGAGGDRDKTKRPIMGAMVEHFAKVIIITSDNPRSEEPIRIINDILDGIKSKDRATVEPDRKKAIEKALNLAKNGEVVVILGKGDEPYQEIKGVKYPYSDKDTVRKILKLEIDNAN